MRTFRWTGKPGAPDGSAVTDHWDWKKALDPKDRLAEIASFGEDADGEIYLVSMGGTIRKFVPALARPATPPSSPRM